MFLDSLAGLLGGAAGVVVGHPFDTVKVRLQTQQIGGKYHGTFHCFKEIVKQESAFGLLKGISSPLAGLAFINAVVFGTYGASMKYFSSLYGDNIRSYFFSGVTAGLVQSFICSPMEMAKLRLQCQGQGVWAKHMFFYIDPPLRYTGPVDCLRQLYVAQGHRGIFRGLPLTILRDGPCFGIYFSSYEWIVRSMTSEGPESLTSAKLLFAGGTAGMLSWLFLYPVDVVKSRYQADFKSKYAGSWDCAVRSYKSDGWRVFFHGLTPALLRAFPTNAVTFFTVEWVFRLANGYLLKADNNAKRRSTGSDFIQPMALPLDVISSTNRTHLPSNPPTFTALQSCSDVVNDIRGRFDTVEGTAMTSHFNVIDVGVGRRASGQILKSHDDVIDTDRTISCDGIAPVQQNVTSQSANDDATIDNVGSSLHMKNDVISNLNEEGSSHGGKEAPVKQTRAKPVDQQLQGASTAGGSSTGCLDSGAAKPLLY